METVGQKIYCFEEFSLDLRRGVLCRGNNEIDLRPKGFELLHYLVENAGRLIPKDELIEAVWPNVIVTDESLTRCVSDVRQALSDGEQRIIKTVPRRGYLLAASVSPHPVTFNVPAAITSPSTSPRLSIVVLPFVNLGGDTEQDYFVDAITENLTTDLSRIRGAFVIAYNTALSYKGKAVPAPQIGRELGVHYVLEGSMQSGPNRMRVNAQLIDAETGAHLWAERFDKPRTDMFEMQDEITARLARTIGIEIVAAESRRSEQKFPNSMDSFDLFLRGRAIWNQPPSLERAREARRLFEAALRLDCGNVGALVCLASTHTYELIYYASDDSAEQIRAAKEIVLKTLALAPDSASAHLCYADLLYTLRAPERALLECELAVSLEPNHAWSHAMTGAMKAVVGRAEETEAHVAMAIRLSPRDPWLGNWYFYVGAANLHLGKLHRAIEQLQRSVDLNPNIGISWFYLAAALALFDHRTEGCDACAAGMRITPQFSISKLRAKTKSDNPTFLAQCSHVLEGMRKAGVPE